MNRLHCRAEENHSNMRAEWALHSTYSAGELYSFVFVCMLLPIPYSTIKRVEACSIYYVWRKDKNAIEGTEVSKWNEDLG